VASASAAALTAVCCSILGAPSVEAATPTDRNVRSQAAATAAAQQLSFGVWTEFSVGATGSETGTFTFYSATPVLLRVTDALCRGDEFRVFDRGFALFNTTTVGTDPSCDDEPFVTTGAEAWADHSYSKGKFLLQPGWHSVKIRITDSPFSSAAAFLRIDKRPIR
jgi:hypothetical protein